MVETSQIRSNNNVSEQDWKQFELVEPLVDSLQANGFMHPTEVQARSLVFLESRVDMIIAARTGQGKTLCFGVPILDLCIRKIQKSIERLNESDEESKFAFDGVQSLVLSPTRELAIQIKDMIEAVIPTEHQDTIKVAAIVGGMSI